MPTTPSFTEDMTLFLRMGGGVAPLALSSSAKELRRTQVGIPMGGGLKAICVGGALAGGAGACGVSADPVERRKKLFRPRDRGREL
jgi:hypothetical protein